MVEPGRSPHWTKEAVADNLAREAPGRQVQVVVALRGDVPSDANAIRGIALELVEAARRSVAESVPAPIIGKAFAIARSFSLTADPKIIQALAADPAVKALTSDSVTDIYPKPMPSRSPAGEW